MRVRHDWSSLEGREGVSFILLPSCGWFSLSVGDWRISSLLANSSPILVPSFSQSFITSHRRQCPIFFPYHGKYQTYQELILTVYSVDCPKDVSCEPWFVQLAGGVQGSMEEERRGIALSAAACLTRLLTFLPSNTAAHSSLFWAGVSGIMSHITYRRSCTCLNHCRFMCSPVLVTKN